MMVWYHRRKEGYDGLPLGLVSVDREVGEDLIESGHAHRMDGDAKPGNRAEYKRRDMRAEKP